MISSARIRGFRGLASTTLAATLTLVLVVPLTTTRSFAASKKVLFTLSSSDSTLFLAPGDDASLTIRSSRTKGFSNPIYLGVGGVPSGVTVRSKTNPLRTSSSSSELNISIKPTFVAKNFTLVVSGSSKGQTSRASIRVNVGVPNTLPPTTPPGPSAPTTVPTPTIVPTTAPSLTPTTKAVTTTTSGFQDYTVAVDPAVVSVPAGGTATATLKITRTGGFSEELNGTLEGLPLGMTGSVDTVSGSASTSTIRLSAVLGTTVGTTDVVVRVRGRSATFKVNVTTLGVVAVPTALTLIRGASGVVNVALGRPVTASLVTWSVDSLPIGVTATFTPNTSTAVTTILTVGSTTSASTGTFPLSVRASTDTVSFATTVSLTLSDTTTATGTITPSVLTLAPGAAGTVAFTPPALPTTSLPSLSVAGLPTGASSTGFSTSGTTFTVNFATLASTAAGSYPVTISVSQGGAVSSGVFTLVVGTVATLPGTANVVLTTSATSLSIARGSFATMTVLTAWATGVTPTAITFEVLGGPTGMSSSFNVNPNATGTTTTLTIPSTAAVGQYTVTVRGTIPTVGTSSVSFVLNVT